MAKGDPNEGALFKNDDANEINRRPPYTGSCDIECPTCGAKFGMWLSAWVNTAKASGKRFFGLRFEPKDNRPRTQPKPEEGYDDDVPF